MDQERGRGFQPIGSLLPKTEFSPKSADSTRIESPMSSGTTGAPNRALTAAKPTGRQLTATDAASLRELAATGNDPEATDMRLRAYLTPLVSLSAKCDWMTDDPGRMGEIIGYEIQESVDLDAAREAVEAAMTPLPPERLMKELVKLRALTASRNAADSDLALTLSAYAEALSGHPGDALVACMRSWPRRNKFWPTLAEIEDGVSELTANRRMIERAINQRRVTPRSPAPEPERDPPTAEEIAEVERKLRALGIPAPEPRDIHTPKFDLDEPTPRQRMRAVFEETKDFRLPEIDSESVQKHLREMGVTE
jgi:hypothetical protein